MCEESGDEACWAVYNEIIRWRPDLANATIPINQFGSIPLSKASYQRLKFILDNKLWSICLITPKTDAPNYTFYNSCDAVKWVKDHQSQIISSAKRNGLPFELVAGILASELDFDYSRWDQYIDNALKAGGDKAIAAYLKARPNPGPGIASIHLSTWEIVQQYYLDCGYDLGETFAPGGQTLSQIEWFKTLLTPTGAIEGASAVARFLADYRTGSNGQPKKTTHYNDLNAVDMAQIFGAYRAGVGGLTCSRDDNKDGNLDCGFQSIRIFQNTDNLGDEAQQAKSYFVFFQRYFEYYQLQGK